ncbi:hypothetical protein [Streptomyces solicathayae]|uniref:Uncharacterized protein n=1 Tax=Streptomyces solicathayae TaxID=3081768 RepID=A0ABZ0LLE3_9ACTN|nr:hypothetical protein [Streptomyces sp. HUAS YS2]WOX20313.1 hypothetical protein R2D22_02485 [Streptomyces sp. HUAS YS2]
MSASEKSDRDPSRRSGADHVRPAEEMDAHAVERPRPAATGALRALPAPFAEKARTAAYVARGTGGTLWAAVRSHKAATGGAVVGATAAITGAYALGRRARRRSGPLARLLGSRF